jgi:hypothetical protein
VFRCQFGDGCASRQAVGQVTVLTVDFPVSGGVPFPLHESIVP